MMTLNILLAISSIAFPMSGVAQSPSTHDSQAIQNSDTRLTGKWQSNKEKTIKYLWRKPGVSEENRKRFEDLFGRLVIEYTSNEMRSTLDGSTDSGPYQVIAKDRNSVVIQIKDIDGEPKLVHIHFIENGYFVVSTGNFIEYFQRIQ